MCGLFTWVSYDGVALNSKHPQWAREVQLGLESFNINNVIQKFSSCVNEGCATAFSTLKTIYVTLMRKSRAPLYSFHDEMLLCDGSVKLIKAYRQWQKQAATLPWKLQPSLYTCFKWAIDSIVKICCTYNEPEIEFNWISVSNFQNLQGSLVLALTQNPWHKHRFTCCLLFQATAQFQFSVFI